MKYQFGKIVVISLGGSIVYPKDIDLLFLKDFKKLIERETRKGRKFVVVIGGGHLARIFQQAAEHMGQVTDEDKDWIGIHATRLNAQLLRTVFKKIADPIVFDQRKKITKLTHPVTIASGWRPGWSTDFVAAAIAKDLGVGEYLEVGKPDHVYDKDPSVYRDAKPFEIISWEDYRRLIPRKWVPGSHSPVDPIAAKLSSNAGIRSIVLDGRDLKNFQNLLGGRDFRGTIIQ